MALNFKDMQGKAASNAPDRIKFVNGINKFRMVGEILPRYVYWMKLADGSGSVPVECLGFNREAEKFENKEKDWITHYYPNLKCSWSYVGLAIDRTDGKVKAVDHKKGLLNDIIKYAKKMGDPTDMDNGWDIVAERKKTGPLPYNVEYGLEFGDIENSALTDEEKTAVAEFKSLDEIFKRQTPEEQRKFIEEKILPQGLAKEEDIPQEMVKEESGEKAESSFDDDIPF